MSPKLSGWANTLKLLEVVMAVILLVRFAKRGFQQASRITLTKFCCGNDSCGNALPHHVRLASTLKLFERGFESFAHRRNCLGVEPSRFYK
jgi:hypothetical protein